MAVVAGAVGQETTEVWWPDVLHWHHFSINTSVSTNLTLAEARERFPDAFLRLVTA